MLDLNLVRYEISQRRGIVVEMMGVCVTTVQFWNGLGGSAEWPEAGEGKATGGEAKVYWGAGQVSQWKG